MNGSNRVYELTAVLELRAPGTGRRAFGDVFVAARIANWENGVRVVQVKLRFPVSSRVPNCQSPLLHTFDLSLLVPRCWACLPYRSGCSTVYVAVDIRTQPRRGLFLQSIFSSSVLLAHLMNATIRLRMASAVYAITITVLRMRTRIRIISPLIHTDRRYVVEREQLRAQLHSFSSRLLVNFRFYTKILLKPHLAHSPHNSYLKFGIANRYDMPLSYFVVCVSCQK